MGKKPSSWLPAFAGYFIYLLYAVLIVRIPFLYGVWVRMWNSIISVPGHCLFIYFSSIACYELEMHDRDLT